jgi:hypothetical protein
MRGKIILASAVLVVLPSAAHSQTFDMFADAVEVQHVRITRPANGERRTISAGEALIEGRSARKAAGATLLGAVQSPPKVSNAFAIEPGEQLFQINTRAAFKACWVELGPEGMPPCLLDDDGDGAFDRAASSSLRKARPLPAPVRYERAEVLIPPASAGFARVLLYQGATGDTIRLSYREFSQNLARDAFSEDLTIPIGSTFPQRISAKGVIIEIYGIDGLGLDYAIEDAADF